VLVDYARIIGLAAWVRQRAGLTGTPPPYSTRHILETVFPKIAVAGDASMPKGVTEMAIHDKGRRALFYSKKVSHPVQRIGLMHGLYHHMTDMKTGMGLIRECNLVTRALGQYHAPSKDPLELSCDLFAAEILIPLDVLDGLAPDIPYSKNPKVLAALDDETDHLSSRFNVPKGFMRWRLYDLIHFRKTHFNTSK
jgi:Zn-dependent peptidase ImmA (M78 family)